MNHLFFTVPPSLKGNGRNDGQSRNPKERDKQHQRKQDVPTLP